MAINKELPERKVNLILGDIENVRQLSLLPLETYLADARNEALAERYLERIIGRAIGFRIVLGRDVKDLGGNVVVAIRRLGGGADPKAACTRRASGLRCVKMSAAPGCSGARSAGQGIEAAGGGIKEERP